MLRNRLSPMDNNRFKPSFSLWKVGNIFIPLLRMSKRCGNFENYPHTFPHSHTSFINNSDSGSSFNLGAYSFDRSAEFVVRAHRSIDFTNRVDDGGVISVPEQPANMSKWIVQ